MLPLYHPNSFKFPHNFQSKSNLPKEPQWAGRDVVPASLQKHSLISEPLDHNPDCASATLNYPKDWLLLPQRSQFLLLHAFTKAFFSDLICVLDSSFPFAWLLLLVFQDAAHLVTFSLQFSLPARSSHLYSPSMCASIYLVIAHTNCLLDFTSTSKGP